ncbi:MAG: ABC transporter ATP-binding protein [Desulfobulbaceae bacterium]|nr:ABC transporter ATP-binding protein [Desulfobulbaceae bacterium]HIJ89330.1 ABC transporter ATP-binding protein [Deltaproteobacteria bacterium]
MSSEFAISLDNLGKCYHLYDKPRDRLLQMLSRGRHRYYREFWALKDVSFTVGQGECLGIIGRNGSGKSTLLQLVCGTLNPTGGEVSVQGRVAALLELGAGFNPEFSGRENVFLNAAVMGLTPEEAKARFEDIVEFSGIRDFIDQPVKTYSSGMYVRLAFSIATSVAPDILVVDEALSVGDGEFARRSFDRIMALKEQGKTILFCSHSLYQVEAFCDRAVWLEGGKAMMIGQAREVVSAYNDFLDRKNIAPPSEHAEVSPSLARPQGGSVRLDSVQVWAEGTQPSREITVDSRKDNLCVRAGFVVSPEFPVPAVGVTVTDVALQTITSAGTHIDGFELRRDEGGYGEVVLRFPLLPLLKGDFLVHVYLLCERGIHIYDQAIAVARLHVRQNDLEQGVVSVPHEWRHDV